MSESAKSLDTTGHYENMREAFQQANVSALAVRSLFNFGDNNTIRAKAFLSNPASPFKVALMARLIHPTDRFVGSVVTLRLVTLADCTERYVAWLADGEINRYLETRWAPQSLASVRSFVQSMAASEDSYLFAIVENTTKMHVGNIKVGPIHSRHAYADVSYFIGERSFWGRGLASEAIRLASEVAFERLGLHRMQAGLYEGNVGSARALEKAGYVAEARQRKQLRAGDAWEDHVWYGLLREDWAAQRRT